MTDETAYSNRELDAKFESVEQASNSNRRTIVDELKNATNSLELRISDNDRDYRGSLTRIEAQVAFTNGKVRKIIVALIFLAGLTIGLGFTEAKVLLPLLGL